MRMEEEKISKKAWLDYLYYTVGKQNYNFELCVLELTQQGDINSTKWKKYSEVIFPVDFDEEWKIEWINNRTIFPFELVLDIEDPKELPAVMEKIERVGIVNYSLYETGSKGYHIHIFHNSVLNEEDKSRYIDYFKADKCKCVDRTMIALENCPHWKTGKMKRRIEWKK